MLNTRMYNKWAFRALFCPILLICITIIFLPTADTQWTYSRNGNVSDSQPIGTGGNVGRKPYRVTHRLDNDSDESNDDDSDTTSEDPDVMRMSLDFCVLDRDYEFTFYVSGGTEPYKWEITSGVLPEGITLDSAAGKLSGRPVEGGIFPIDVKVTDSSDPRLSDTEAFQLHVYCYEYAVPIYGLDVSDTYIANYGPERISIRSMLAEADTGGGLSDNSSIDENAVIATSDMFGTVEVSKVLKLYSDNYLSVINDRRSSDRQIAWKYTCLPTAKSAGKNFVFTMTGWSTAAIFIANAGLDYEDATVNIDISDSNGQNVSSYQMAIPPYQMRNTFDLFGNLFGTFPRVMVKITSDREITVNAGSWNLGDRGGWGREILPLDKSKGRNFQFAVKGYENAGAEILNTSDTSQALVNIKIYDENGVPAVGGQFNGIAIPAHTSVNTADIAGLGNIYSKANPAVVKIESTNEVDIIVHSSCWTSENAGMEFSTRPKEYAAGTTFFFSPPEITHARFDIANAGSITASAEVTVYDRAGENPQKFSIQVPANGVVDSYDFIPGDLYNLHKPAVVKIESKNSQPLLVRSIAQFDALTEGSIEACGSTIYPITSAGGFRITSIERDESTNDIILTFQSLENVKYDILYSDDDYGDTMTWLVATSDIEGDGGGISYRDDGSDTGTHPAGADKRFYAIKKSNTGTMSDNVVGVYKIHLGLDRNLVSSPLIPLNGGLDSLIGNQLTGSDFNKFFSDTIARWNQTTEEYETAYYDSSEGKWKDFDTDGPPTFEINADEGYWMSIHALHDEQDLLLVGEVSAINREIELKLNRNLTGSSYPVSIPLDDSGLIESGFTGSGNRSFSDLVQWWNSENANYDTVYYNSDTSQWMDWEGTVATRKLEPGQGVWITIRDFNQEFNWVVTKPY